MRKWSFAFAVAATMLGGCDLLGPSAEVRYRITIVINTPQGVRSASGVWAFKLMPGPLGQRYGYSSRFRGEAIPVSLPDGRTMFALLDLGGVNQPAGDAMGQLPEMTLARRYYPEARYPDDVGTSRINRIEFLKEQVRDKVRLDCRPNPFDSECPLLVAFAKPSDQTSVFAVDPDDMAATLGRGYSLAGIYLQITDDAPTRQLGQFKWERAIAAQHWDGPYANRPLASRLSIRSFKRWDS